MPRILATLTLLTIPLAAGPGAAQQSRFQSPQAQADTMRFRAMDQNGDGVITRQEWRGTVGSFRTHDWNNDGMLSGDEVRVNARRRDGFGNEDFDPPAAGRFDSWTQPAFAQLDHNGDGRINANEWHYDQETFRRADRNGDGSLSSAEFLGNEVDDDREDQFEDLDVNRNGRVERNEWHGSAETFGWLDRNRDGVLSRAEVVGTPARGRGNRNQPNQDDQFASLDINGDGRISPNEWHWSRTHFDQLDTNRDGSLNRREMYSAATAAVGTGGQIVRVDPTLRWTDTGLYLRTGDSVTISAEGTIEMSQPSTNDIATPAGSRLGRLAPDAPLRQQPAGALIGRIGDSAPMFIGDRRTHRAPVSGRLYLGVNDDHLDDNTGEFRVTISIQGQ